MAGKVFEIAFAINGALAQSFKTSMLQTSMLKVRAVI